MSQIMSKQRYMEYHWFGADNSQTTGGVRMFTPLDAQHVGADLRIGLTEEQALLLFNLWNQGEHHRFRYWIDNPPLSERT